MNILSIKEQSLSSVLCRHQVCQICRIIDMDKNRTRIGYPCPVCNTPSPGGLMYFNLSIHVLINLMQEAYHSKSDALDKSHGNKRINAHDISVVLFFCTLREILLNNLIKELCRAQKIPEPIYDRLISDNRFHLQRQDQLLPALIGVKWKNSLKVVGRKHSHNYMELDNFITKAVKARNDFMHHGYKWSIPETMPKDCLQNTELLINLYVGLHNSYVHPHYNT